MAALNLKLIIIYDTHRIETAYEYGVDWAVIHHISCLGMAVVEGGQDFSNNQTPCGLIVKICETRCSHSSRISGQTNRYIFLNMCV